MVVKEVEARQRREWSSSRFRTSTELPSASCHGVESHCQVSLGSWASKRTNEGLGRLCGCGVTRPCDAASCQPSQGGAADEGTSQPFLTVSLARLAVNSQDSGEVSAIRDELIRLLGGEPLPHSLATREKVPFTCSRYDFGIVGEASYQAALKRISRGRQEAGQNVVFEVLVVREPGNRYDPHAIRILVNGVGTVG